MKKFYLPLILAATCATGIRGAEPITVDFVPNKMQYMCKPGALPETDVLVFNITETDFYPDHTMRVDSSAPNVQPVTENQIDACPYQQRRAEHACQREPEHAVALVRNLGFQTAVLAQTCLHSVLQVGGYRLVAGMNYVD